MIFAVGKNHRLHREPAVALAKAGRYGWNMYFVYIIKSINDGWIYIGKTRDVDERLKEHNGGYVDSTKYKRPFEIISYFAFKDRRIADSFERYLKTASGRAFLSKRVFAV